MINNFVIIDKKRKLIFFIFYLIFFNFIIMIIKILKYDQFNV